MGTSLLAGSIRTTAERRGGGLVLEPAGTVFVFSGLTMRSCVSVHKSSAAKFKSLNRSFLLLLALSTNQLCVTAGHAQEHSPISKNQLHPLADWRAVEGTWLSNNGRLTGEVSDTKRGFSVADDGRFAYSQTVETRFTPVKH